MKNHAFKFTLFLAWVGLSIISMIITHFSENQTIRKPMGLAGASSKIYYGISATSTQKPFLKPLHELDTLYLMLCRVSKGYSLNTSFTHNWVFVKQRGFAKNGYQFYDINYHASGHNLYDTWLIIKYIKNDSLRP